MRRLLQAALVVVAGVLAVVATPTLAAAEGDRVVAVWMASDLSSGIGGESWGRLVLRDGMVSFRSVDGRQGWDLLLADTNRVQQSKTHSKAVEIESVTGQVYVVSILDSQMLVDSPRRAMRMISGARQAVPAVTRLAAAEAGTAQLALADSAKVVRFEGGPIR